MLTTLKNNWRQLRHGKPGRRFRDFYTYRAEHRSGPFSAARIAMIVIGIALIAGGVAIGWLPGPGGFIAIFGFALLAQEFRPIAVAMDWSETILRKAWAKFRKLPTLVKAGAYLLSLCVGAGAFYLSYVLWSG